MCCCNESIVVQIGYIIYNCEYSYVTMIRHQQFLIIVLIHYMNSANIIQYYYTNINLIWYVVVIHYSYSVIILC